MTEQFANYKQSLALKQLGFDEPCFGGWDYKQKWYYHPDSDIKVDAPLKQQVFEWFRKYHKLMVGAFQPMEDTTDEVKGYYFEIGIVGNLSEIDRTTTFDTFEEAESACIDTLIHIVKTK